jgi:hypothetical protein
MHCTGVTRPRKPSSSYQQAPTAQLIHVLLWLRWRTHRETLVVALAAAVSLRALLQQQREESAALNTRLAG